VGQQVTVVSNYTAAADRAKLLLARAGKTFKSKILGGTVTEADVVVKGVKNGVEKGYWYKGRTWWGAYKFKSDENKTVKTLNSLLASFDGPATFTAVPPGSGKRIGIDRDLDGVLNGNE